MLARQRKKSLQAAIGRRNRLPHQSKSSSYGKVGQALSPVERLFRNLSRMAVPIQVAFLFGPVAPAPDRGGHYQHETAFDQDFFAVQKVGGLALQILIDQDSVNEKAPAAK